MPRRSALQRVLHVPRGGVLQAVLCQRVSLQLRRHDGGGVAFDGDGGRWGGRWQIAVPVRHQSGGGEQLHLPAQADAGADPCPCHGLATLVPRRADHDCRRSDPHWRAAKPVICKVYGFAVAGGSDIALCADLTIMAEDAQIGYMPARV